MNPRDELEQILRGWDTYERTRTGSGIVDFDCHPDVAGTRPVEGRLQAHDLLTALAAEYPAVRLRAVADITYLRALMGERLPLADYLIKTQGLPSAGWPEEYVTAVGELSRQHLDALGVPWGEGTEAELERVEEPVSPEEAPDVIRAMATELEPAVRALVDASAPYQLTIESTYVDAYWSYWLDGAGDQVRLRINAKSARFTRTQARVFALHEVLGHGLQSASFSAQAQQRPVPWVRILSVHAPTQFLLEGLAQALPLFVVPSEPGMAARVRLGHYTQLVRAELHRALDAGASLDDCVDHARTRVPFWSDNDISDALADRSVNPLLRSYLWAYPAGIDWFVALAGAEASTARKVLRAAYRDPLTPSELGDLWPQGPAIGGPGGPFRLRKPHLR